MSPPPEMPDSQETLRLTSADFDAYLPERATSNAFTRPRLELKQRMMAWARGVVTRLAELGVAVEVTGSDEHPSPRNGRRVDCQRVFLWRDAPARAEVERLVDRKRSLASTLGDPAPHQKHAFLALRVDATHVEVSVEVHPDAWVDARNLRARLADPALTLELTSALEALPEQFTIGLSPASPPPARDGASDGGGSVEHAAPDAGGPEGGSRTPAQEASSESVRDVLDRGDADGRSTWIGWSVPRDVAVTHSAVLDEQLEDAIVALGPLYKLIAWAPDNDLVVLGQDVAEAKAHALRVHEEAEKDRAGWEARREREGRRPRAPASERVEPAHHARARWSSITGAPGEAKEHSSSSPLAVASASRPRLPLRAVVRAGRSPASMVTEVDPTAPIEKGTRVQVLAGPFEGKVGVVQELDGKGGARVMLGLLAARLEVTDLIAAAEGKDRPALASSHRKPIPARS
jgi:hypothetical protein